MEQIRKEIKSGANKREALIRLRDGLEDGKGREQLQQLFAEDPQVLLDCLQDPDPKVRKNGARLLGLLSGDEIPEALWKAYEQEEQLFVRADYLKALQSFDCTAYLDCLRKRNAVLREQLSAGGEENKHFRAEWEQLQKLLLSYDKPQYHPFAGLHTPADVILMTDRGCERATADQIARGKVHLLKGGVLVEQADLTELLGIRTWRNLYFCLTGSRKMRPEQLTEKLPETNLIELLQTLLKGAPPYYFRIECRSPRPLSERSRLCKRLAAGLEEKTAGMLLNRPSGYELELCLTENQDGTFYPLLKLSALPDQRFAYRRRVVAASMSPVQAAIAMELAAPYLKEKGRVLDPFCGVGTLLLERNYRVKADTLYGIDSYGAAIEAARENAEAAGIPVHYVNRDALTFQHTSLFDEIVTDFPVKGKTKDAHAIDVLYGQFLDKAASLLNPDGTILLLTHDKGYLKKHLRLRREWKAEQEWCLSKKEEVWLFCIRRRAALSSLDGQEEI